MAKYPGSKMGVEYGNADEFGKFYTGSARAKHNQLKNKKLKKQSK